MEQVSENDKEHAHAHMKIDRFGRVVIPYEIREALNLKPGTGLEVYHESEDRIILRVVVEKPLVTDRNGWLVVDDAADEAEDTVEGIRKDHESRDQKNAGYEK